LLKLAAGAHRSRHVRLAARQGGTSIAQMSSKYGKPYNVPADLPPILKAFSREVLRAQPENLYEFGEAYFNDLLAQAEADAAQPAVTRLSKAELQETFTQMFQQADADGSGALDMKEFKEVLSMADLGLTNSQIKSVMSEADVDGSGTISYVEFIPLAVDLVNSMYAKMEMEAEKEEARQNASDYLVKGMTPEQLEATMRDVFVMCDVDGSGALSLPEFQKCCQDAGIGLTRKEINHLMLQCDVDGDGMITYEEFTPLCHELLVEILAHESKQPSELEELMIQIFQDEDVNEYGLLDPITMSRVLKSLDFGLTNIQTHSILSTLTYNAEGYCDYVPACRLMSEIMYKMLDQGAQQERAAQINALIRDQRIDFDVIHGCTAPQMAALLKEELSAADAAGTGLLDRATVAHVLANSALQLSTQEVNGVLSCVDPDPNGFVNTMQLSEIAFFVLQYIAQEAAVAA